MKGRAFQLCDFIGQQFQGNLISKMNDRYYQMIDRSYQVIDRSYQVIDRSYQIQLQNLNLSSLKFK